MRHTSIRLPKGELLDPWDPNNWEECDHEHRIYGCADLSIYAVVDAVDYPLLSRYRWSVHKSKRMRWPYLRRNISVFHGPDGSPYESEFTGRLERNRNRTQYTRFLHTDVLLLAGIPQPTPQHKEGDHKDRDVMNCRRTNLQWATRSMNVTNSEHIGVRVKR